MTAVERTWQIEGRKMRAPVIIKIFDPSPDSDFAAYHTAEQWLKDLGYCVGPMQRGAPTAAYIGDGFVSKWRNLTDAERDAVDGLIHDMGRGRFRGGPVEVVLYALSEEGKRL